SPCWRQHWLLLWRSAAAAPWPAGAMLLQPAPACDLHRQRPGRLLTWFVAGLTIAVRPPRSRPKVDTSWHPPLPVSAPLAGEHTLPGLPRDWLRPGTRARVRRTTPLPACALLRSRWPAAPLPVLHPADW